MKIVIVKFLYLGKISSYPLMQEILTYLLFDVITQSYLLIKQFGPFGHYLISQQIQKLRSLLTLLILLADLIFKQENNTIKVVHPEGLS